jgi:hypothetical protein
MVLQSHKGAAAFKNKSFPLYEELCIVYAKDHATGRDAQTPIDICEDLQNETCDENNIGQNEKDGFEEFNEDVSCTQLPTNGNGGLSGQKRKKPNKSTEDNLAKKFLEIGNQLATNLITASENLSKAVTGSVERESRLKVNDELSKIIGLSSKDRLKAARLIVCQHEIMDLFFSVPDHDKEELVRGIINDA